MGLNKVSTGNPLLRPVWLRSRLLTFRKEVLTIDSSMDAPQSTAHWSNLKVIPVLTSDRMPSQNLY